MRVSSLAFILAVAGGFGCGRGTVGDPPGSTEGAISSQLIRNGSFEAGLSPWQFNVWGAAAATQGQDSNAYTSGGHSERVAVTAATPSASWNAQLRQQGLALKAGATITVTLQAMAVPGRSILVALQQGAAPYTVYFQKTLDVGQGWGRYSFTYTQPAADSNAQLAVNYAGATGQVWLDEVSVTQDTSGPATDGGPSAPPDAGPPPKTDAGAPPPVDAGVPPPADAGTPGGTSHIYWGAYEDGRDTYDFYYGPPGFWLTAPWGNTGNTMDRFDSNAGKKVSILAFSLPALWSNNVFPGAQLDVISSRGAIPMLTMAEDGSLSAISSGQYDAQIRTWVQAAAAYGKPFFFRLGWEMNGDWYSWGAQPAAYVAAWRHFHDLANAAGATNINWHWCPNIAYGPPLNANLAQYYPGDAYVDWMGLDGYSLGSTQQSFQQVYQNSYDQLVAISNKPILIGEVSSLEYGAGAKAAWITDMLQTELPTRFPRIKGFSWFNWRVLETDAGVTRNQPFPIESSASSQAAFKAGIASPYYLAGGTFPLPARGAKIPAP